MGSRTVPSNWFPCDFDIVGHPRPLHEAGQTLSLLSSGIESKGHGIYIYIYIYMSYIN